MAIGQKNGLQLIQDERRRQIEVKGYTAEKDDQYTMSELCLAAHCYEYGVIESWPWDRPKSRDVGRHMIIAGALYQAELDRLNRLPLDSSSYEAKNAMTVHVHRVARKIDENIRDGFVFDEPEKGFFEKYLDVHHFTVSRDTVISIAEKGEQVGAGVANRILKVQADYKGIKQEFILRLTEPDASGRHEGIFKGLAQEEVNLAEPLLKEPRIESLTKENFWNALHMTFPKGMKKFCNWIDDYKKRVGWGNLFMSEFIKYHHLPVGMQIGIFVEFAASTRSGTGFEYNGSENFRDASARGIMTWFMEFEKRA